MKPEARSQRKASSQNSPAPNPTWIFKGKQERRLLSIFEKLILAVCLERGAGRSNVGSAAAAEAGGRGARVSSCSGVALHVVHSRPPSRKLPNSPKPSTLDLETPTTVEYRGLNTWNSVFLRILYQKLSNPLPPLQ